MIVDDLYKPGIEDFYESYSELSDSKYVANLFKAIKEHGDNGTLSDLNLTKFDFASIRGAMIIILMSRQDFGNVGATNYMLSVRTGMHIDCDEDREVAALVDGVVG